MSELSAILTLLYEIKQYQGYKTLLTYAHFFGAGGGAWKSLTGFDFDSSICF